MKLVIVESPTKTKSLTQYLGSGYQVLATQGHLRDLPKSKMGVEIKDSKFIPEYINVKGKGKQIKKLKEAAKKADVVYLATDPDREGEAISWHTLETIRDKKDKDDKFKRITFHSITKEAVLEALKHPRQIDQSLVDAQQARRVLDRLVGYNLSPVLWRKVRRGLSGGRVQSVAVRLIVDREREIEAFKPEEYWIINVKVQSSKMRDEFWVELTKINGKTAKVTAADQAHTIEQGLKKGSYQIVDIVRKERRAWPKPPFKTSTLQQAAANVLGWSSKKTMQVAQHLYEGGFITYHRTDSLSLVGSAVTEIRGFVGQKYGSQYLPEKSKGYKTGGKVVAQEAHEAIRPTHIQEGPAKLAEADERKLYDLIWRRTLACQMKEAVYDTTTILVDCDSDQKYRLQAKGEIEKFAGWRVLYPKNSKEIEVEESLPEVRPGDRLDYQQLNLEQKFTQPPARYNDASLVKELEKRGIGRPSTYAPTISTILARNYVEKKDRRFYPTTIGVAVTDFLVKNFPKEMDYEFTANMEEGLDDIARGKQEWEKYLSSFYGPFKTDVENVAQKAERIEMPVEKTGEKCPECKEGEVVIREGRFGKFLSCSRFPECKYTARYNQYLEGVKCEKCGGRVVIKKTRFGKEFYGCENYPKCDWATWKKPKVEGQEEESDTGE